MKSNNSLSSNNIYSQQQHIISTNNENITNVIIGDTPPISSELEVNYQNNNINSDSNCNNNNNNNSNPVTISIPCPTIVSSTLNNSTTEINLNYGHVNLIECDTTTTLTSSSSNVNISSSLSSSLSHPRNNANSLSSTNADQQQLSNLPDILNSINSIPPPYNLPPPPYSTLPPPNSSLSSRLAPTSSSSSVTTNLRSLLGHHLNVGSTSPASQPTSNSSQQISFLLPPSWQPQDTSYLSPSSVPIPPHSTAHHHHRGPSCLRRGCPRESDAETTTSKSCLTCTGISIKWFILLVSFIGLVCAVIGTFLGAARPLGRERFTLALLMIGIGIVLIVVSGIAWRLTSAGPTWRALFGFSDLSSSSGLHGNSLETTSRRFMPRVPAAHGRSGAHHHPYGAMFYPEFQYRPPPPSYQASMQEYRLRLLLLERSSSNAPQVTSASSAISPPPSYRSSANNNNNNISAPQTTNAEVNINCDASNRNNNINTLTNS